MKKKVILCFMLLSFVFSSAAFAEDTIILIPEAVWVVPIPIIIDEGSKPPPPKEPEVTMPRQTIIHDEEPPRDYCKPLGDVYVQSSENADIYQRNWDCKHYSDNGTVYVESVSKVILNYNQIYFEQLPIVINGNTLVPFRSIAESLGAQVGWNDNTKTISVTTPTDRITLQVDNAVIQVNGKEVALEVPPTTLNGITMVPIRAVAESLGAKVEYDAKSDKINITARLKGKVTNVMDGSTIKVQVGSKEETVRIVGLTIPQDITDVSKKKPFHRVVYDFAKSRLMDKMVELELDEHQRDQDKNLLAYVWVDGTLFNQTLLQEGYAKYDQSVLLLGDQMNKHLEQYENEARRLKKGLWSEQMQIAAGNEQSNKASIMSGLMVRVSKGTKSNESVVQLKIVDDKDFVRYSIMPERLKKEIIYQSIKQNATLTDGADTAIVSLSYMGKLYADAVIELNKAQDECTYHFYDDGK